MNLVLFLPELHSRSNSFYGDQMFSVYITICSQGISGNTIFNFYSSCAVEPLSVTPRSENKGTAQRKTSETIHGVNTSVSFQRKLVFSGGDLNLKFRRSKNKG